MRKSAGDIACAVLVALLALVDFGFAGSAHAHQITWTRVAVHGFDPIDLYAEETGVGPPILLLHGLAASSYTWRRIVPALARTHRVIALDLKGFGRSQKPFDTHYSALDQAVLVRQFILQRGLTNLTIIGHSFGGQVAIATALDLSLTAHGRLERLVLIDAPAYPQAVTPIIAFLQKPVLPYVALSLIPPELATSLSLGAEKGRLIEMTPDDVRAYARPYYDPAARHALIETAQQIVPANFARLAARYPSIRQKTLIVWCKADHVVPLSTGLKLARALPNARLAILDGCDHIPQEQMPGQLSAAITKFIGP